MNEEWYNDEINQKLNILSDEELSSLGDTFYQSTNMYEQYIFSPVETLPNMSQALVTIIEILDFPHESPSGSGNHYIFQHNSA